MLTEFTQLPKESWHGTSAKKAHSVTKGSLKEIILWVSVDLLGLANKGISCINILDLIVLLVSSSWLKGWILFVWKCIQANVTR